VKIEENDWVIVLFRGRAGRILSTTVLRRREEEQVNEGWGEEFPSICGWGPGGEAERSTVLASRNLTNHSASMMSVWLIGWQKARSHGDARYLGNRRRTYPRQRWY
jgi:hypothetical protein